MEDVFLLVFWNVESNRLEWKLIQSSASLAVVNSTLPNATAGTTLNGNWCPKLPQLPTAQAPSPHPLHRSTTNPAQIDRIKAMDSLATLGL